ncbi:MAG: M23 family metallopeptidase [Deltaproteobacteria bacterium]|nr:M23 family metallopeptidase [Deltaproteobacteria bacterium]
MKRGSWTLVMSGASLLLAIATVHAQEHAAVTPSSTSAPSASSSPAPTAVPARPEGIQWGPSSGRDCHVFHGRRMCEGPRRVPLLEGEALRRAESLGLVGPRVARLATTAAVPANWLEAARAGGARAPSDLLWPVPEGRLWRGFGPRQGFRRTTRGLLVRTRRRHMHQGVDIGAHEGAVIVAVADGLVAFSDNRMSGYGNAVLLVHADGAVSMYAHCVETYVIPGQVVHRGDVIAAVGQTGIAHGAHLHFEYRQNGHVVDPYRLFTSIPDLPPLARGRRTRPDTDPRIAETDVEVAVPAVTSTQPAEPPADTAHDPEP